MTWADFTDRIAIRFPFKIEIRALCTRDARNSQIEIVLEVPDIATGETSKVITIDHPPPISDVENPARYLRNMVLRALAHELDETFLVDDIKLHDPHRQECYVPPRLLT